MLAQKQRHSGSPRRFYSEACQRREARAKEEKAREEREYRALKKRLTYPERREAHLAYLRENRARYTEHNRAWRARNPRASAEASRRWREKKKRQGGSRTQAS